MPELRTDEITAIHQGLLSLGDLASEKLPNLKEAKELGIPEGDLKTAVKVRQKVRFRAALQLSKLEPIVKEFQKQANEALEEAALKKADGSTDSSEVEGPGGVKQSTVKLDPTKVEDYKTKMQGLAEHLVDVTFTQAFTEQDLEQAMLTVPTRTLVLLGPMAALE